VWFNWLGGLTAVGCCLLCGWVGVVVLFGCLGWFNWLIVISWVSLSVFEFFYLVLVL